MEIAVAGPGEVVIRFIDSRGRTLLQEKLAVSGSPSVQGKRMIALSIITSGGGTPVAPVLIRQSNPKQRVTFDGENPSGFTKKRCEEIGCGSEVAADAERGCAPPPEQGEAGALLSDDPALAQMIEKAAHDKPAGMGERRK